MKFISAIILLIALLAQQYSHYLVLFDFEINKNYIAKNLCENRKKPKSCCQGKCYLKKQLAKTDKEENTPNSNTQKDRNELLFFSQLKNNFTFFLAEEINTSHINHNNTVELKNFSSAVFHPPQV